MAYGITSESQLIDINTINEGCNKIDEAAIAYLDCANVLSDAASIMDINALSVEKKTMKPSIEELAAKIKQVKGNIGEFTNEIRNLASKIFQEQKMELEEYQRKESNKE